MALTRWVRLSVDFIDDDKIAQLTDAQKVLFLRLILWSSRHGTDGRIPSAALPVIAAGYRNVAGALDKFRILDLVQTWSTDEADIAHGWYIKAWAKWQMNSDAARSNIAGHRPAGAGPSHGRTGAGTENRPEWSINNKPQVQQPMRVDIGGIIYEVTAEGLKEVEENGRSPEHAEKKEPTARSSPPLDPVQQEGSRTPSEDQNREAEGGN